MGSNTDPFELIGQLDLTAIRAELDRLYEREAVLRAALRIAKAKERASTSKAKRRPPLPIQPKRRAAT